MKIKILSLLSICIAFLFCSCAKEEEMKKFEATVGDDRIASIEQQIDSINNTVVHLEKLNTVLNKYVSTMQDEIDSMKIIQSKDRESIAKMELAVAEAKAVNEKVLKEIDVLHSYVEKSISGVKGWAERTFITMEYYDTLCAVVSQVKVDMDRVSKDMDSLRADMRIECAAIVEVEVAKAVEKVENSLKDWVNEKLTGYWTIGQTQAELNAVEKKALDSIGVVKSDLQTQIDSARAQLTRGYQSAIKQAIEDYDGVIRGVVKDSITAVNARINALSSRIDALTARVDVLEDQVAKLVARIQSIVPVPDYEDGSFKILSEASDGLSTFRFAIQPSSVAESLAAAWQEAKSRGVTDTIFSVRYVQTVPVTKNSVESTMKMSINNISVSEGDLIVKVNHNNSGFSDSFWLQYIGYSAALYVSAGGCQCSSAYAPLKFESSLKISVPNYVLRYWNNDTTNYIQVKVNVIPSRIADSVKFISSDYDVLRFVNSKGLMYAENSEGTSRAVLTVSCGAMSVSEEFVTVPKGAVPGIFSVSPTRKVIFASGNVQYQASTKTWSFAKHQYDVIGNNPGNNTASGRESQEGWIDLFGWGATGENPNGEKAWSISEDNSKYKTEVNANNFESLDVRKGTDWGYHFVTVTSPNWQTLELREWKYLCLSRKDARNKSFPDCKVANVSGFIIIPDDFVDPNLNEGSKPVWQHASYTSEAWVLMEKAGAVFLPCGGYRKGSTVYYFTDSYGNMYHTTTGWYDSELTPYQSYRISIYRHGDYYKVDRSYGSPVRLVAGANE